MAVAYCGGGISPTVDVFALALLGRNDVRLYDGSLTEGTADPALPVELGRQAFASGVRGAARPCGSAPLRGSKREARFR